MRDAPAFIVKSDRNPTDYIIAGKELSRNSEISFKVDKIDDKKWIVTLIVGGREQLIDAIEMSGLKIEEDEKYTKN